MMERTELREQFFAEVHRDPYAHLILHHVAEAWVDGYEQAMRDSVRVLAVPCGHDEANVVGADGNHARAPQALIDLIDEPYRERHAQAIARLTDRRTKAAAEAIIALAALGPLVGGPTLGKFGGETP